MKQANITATKENYIREIYLLSLQKNECVRSIDVVKNLHLSKSTVSESLKKLSRQKLVLFQRYSCVRLTEKGKLLGNQLTYKHRVIEVFLHKTLGMPKSSIHEEANKLEHAFSDEVIMKLAAFLNFPDQDPHGNAIPTDIKGNNYDRNK